MIGLVGNCDDRTELRIRDEEFYDMVKRGNKAELERYTGYLHGASSLGLVKSSQ